MWKESFVQPSDAERDLLRKLVGLGEHSLRKTYYTELQKGMRELERFRVLLDRVGDGILLASLPDGTLLDANNTAMALFGLSPSDMGTRRLPGIIRDISLDPATASRKYSLSHIRPDSETLALDVTADVALFDNKPYLAILIRDVTERKRFEERLAYLGAHDPLTGLFNRTHFESTIQGMRSEEYIPLGLIICDLDGLKLINDTFGHETGDTLLKNVAGMIQDVSPIRAVTARIGGDEFAILLPYSCRAELERICRDIQVRVGEFNATGKESYLSLSLGFSAAYEQDFDPTDLFKESDNALSREKLLRSQSTRSSLVHTVMTMLEARDFITEGHADRLQFHVDRLAASLGFSGRRRADLTLFAKFHDIGKVGVPDNILFKPGPLTKDEMVIMRRHSAIGHRIALSAPDLLPIADWILKHHEYWDGSGYPIGLSKHDIPLECRMLALADAFDAMTNDRPYRKALPRETAMEEIRRCSGKQFDPELVVHFLRMCEEEESPA